jgi:uncharacterized protein YggE
MISEDASTEPNSKKSFSHSSLVVTQGEATVKRAPDQAWISIATETRELKADDARRRSAENMAAVQARLRTTGLSTDAIRTTRYRLEPDVEWKNGRGTVKGYVAHNQIEVRIDDLDRLSDIIDIADVTGSTVLRISGLHFALKDQQTAETDALRLAVQAAYTRAQAIASGAQRTLGNIARIEEQNIGGSVRPDVFPMQTAVARSSDAFETPIVVEDIEVRARVTLTIELR